MGSRELYYKRVRHYNEPFHAHELTFSCFQRRAFLSRERTCLYLVEALTEARLKHRFHLWAYVFMPEHVHLLVWPGEEDATVKEFLRGVKQSVSRRATNYLREYNPAGLNMLATGRAKDPYRFWQEGPGYDRNVTCRKTLHTMVEYIHANPVRRGLVPYVEDWKWSSAREWSEEGTGLISIDRESFPR